MRLFVFCFVLTVAALTHAGTSNAREPQRLSSAVGEDGVRRVNCQSTPWDSLAQRDVAPHGSGPLRLVSIFCQDRSAPDRQYRYGDPLVSPDGRSIAYSVWDKNYKRVIRIAPLDAFDAWADHPPIIGFFSHLTVGGPLAFQWSAASRFVWATRQEYDGRGFATAPVTTVRLAKGLAEELPALTHEAGPLDGIQWIADGKALALFGARGSFYQRKREDPKPTIAIVDATKGAILESHPVSAFARNALSHADASVLGDGRVRVVIGGLEGDGGLGKLMVWTQGEPLVTVLDSLRDVQRVVISNDGQRMLVVKALVVPCVRDHIPINPAPCAPPFEITFAALHELPSGRLLWNFRMTVDGQGHQSLAPRPAISPDGRYALIGIPQGQRRRFAVVSMRDGQMLQTVSTLGGDGALGFARNGHMAWASEAGLTAIYQVQ